MSYVTFEDLALVGLFSVVGFLLCFFGYRLFRFSLFTVAFLGATVLLLALFVYRTQYGVSTPIPYWIGIVLVSLLCGFLALTFPKAGVFISGICGGFILVSLLVSIIGYTGSPGFLFLLLIVLSVGGGFLAKKYTKLTLMAITSMWGALLLTTVVAYFVALYFAVTASEDEEDYYYYEDRLDSLGTSWGILYMIMLILIGLGILIQFKATGRGNYHEPLSTTQIETDAQQLESGQAVGYENLQTPTNGGVQCVDDSVIRPSSEKELMRAS